MTQTVRQENSNGDTSDLRKVAQTLFAAAVQRADPAQAVRRQLAASPLPTPKGRCFVLAVGKAAVPMMREALRMLGDVHSALVVTNPENYSAVRGATVLQGAHPMPDQTSAKAGAAVAAFLEQARTDDLVLALVSGGGSALMIAPLADVSVADYGAMNALLLGSGLGINDVNLVRQQIDDLKGGGLLKHAHPADVHSFILSDVIGDDRCTIASGPTVASIGTRQQAVSLIKSAGIWNRTPDSIKTHLQQPEPSIDLLQASNHLIGSNRHSLDAMLAATPEGYDARIVSDALVGDVHFAAMDIVRAGLFAKRPTALIFGGETTVQIIGTGQGGRNQELALRVALCAQGVLFDNWVFLSGGTDGRDGPTDAAGGLVDGGTLGRIVTAGGDLARFLDNNDSYAALALAGDLLVTGGTCTNVADVQVLLLS